MNIADMVGQLRAERNRLDAAIQALEGIGGGTSAPGRRRGRPPGSKKKQVGSGLVKRRRMSADARKRIAEAMRKRWAAVKARKK
jgi:hypothetical protein